MHFYRLVKFHIQRCFSASLSVRVSNAGQPVTHARKYCTNKPCHKPYCFILSGSKRRYTLTRNPTILYTQTFSVPVCHLCKKILSKTKISDSSLLQPRELHTSLSTYKCDSKIDFIKLDHFPLVQNINKLI